MNSKSTLLIFFALLLFLFTCSKNDSNSSPPNDDNAPLPVLEINLVSPISVSTVTPSNLVSLKWSVSGISQTDIVNYNVFIGLEENNLHLVAENFRLTEYNFSKLLTNENIYYWKVTASDNNDRTAKSTLGSFSTPKLIGQITDSRDGEVYDWIQIGNQKWLTSNSRFNSTNSLAPENDESNVTNNGRYYNSNEAFVFACPTGWHLPSKEEFDELIDYMEGEFDINEYAKLLKSQTNWTNNYNGNNFSGFNAMPSGFWSAQSGYEPLGTKSILWTSSIKANLNRYIFGTTENLDEFWITDINSDVFEERHCVRCLKN